MIRIHTASRLHFGLLSLAGEGARWPDGMGELLLTARRFGGVGLMVEDPGLRLSLVEAPAWSAAGPLAERALQFAHRFAENADPREAGGSLSEPAVGNALRGVPRAPQPPSERHGGRSLLTGRPPQHILVEQAPPEHAGLGTGTQLGLAVAAGLALAWGLPVEAPALARRVGRGLRSGLGVHGFARGGFLVEAGKGASDDAPLVARCAFPEEWRVVLALPPVAPGLHGDPEVKAFARLAHAATPGAGPLAHTDALCRLVLLGMLPALQERDCNAFGEALFDFNRRVGEVFASVQGGLYASEAVAGLVAYLREQKVKGAGQSSWGPAVFGIVADPERAEHLVVALRTRFGLGPGEVLATRACNHGAVAPDRLLAF